MFAPQNVALSIVFNFSWDNCNTQEKLKTEVIQMFFFGGGGGVGGKQGVQIWEMHKRQKIVLYILLHLANFLWPVW